MCRFREDSPEISSGEEGEIAGEEGEEPEMKKREMGKKKCFVVIKPRVRRIVSVEFPRYFNFNFREIFRGWFARLNENIPRKFRRTLKYPSEFPRIFH